MSQLQHVDEEPWVSGDPYTHVPATHVDEDPRASGDRPAGQALRPSTGSGEDGQLGCHAGRSVLATNQRQAAAAARP